jgi:hypothetical protein
MLRETCLRFLGVQVSAYVLGGMGVVQKAEEICLRGGNKNADFDLAYFGKSRR